MHRLTLATLVVATLTSARLVHAEAGDFELSLTSEALALTSPTVAATTRDSFAFTPGIRLGWSPVDNVTVLLGWRSIEVMSRADRGYDLATSGDALIVGARYSLGLHDIVDLHAELDLEALNTDFELTVADGLGRTSAWAFGAVPKIVGSAKADLGFADLDFRLFVGFAARTNQRADGVRLSSSAPARQVAPLDLGSINLSGLVFGANLALVF